MALTKVERPSIADTGDHEGRGLHNDICAHAKRLRGGLKGRDLAFLPFAFCPEVIEVIEKCPPVRCSFLLRELTRTCHASFMGIEGCRTRMTRTPALNRCLKVAQERSSSQRGSRCGLQRFTVGIGLRASL